MPSSANILAAVGAVVAYVVFTATRALRANIAAAHQTGLPYVVAPCSPFNLLWQLSCGLWTPLVKLLLPSSCWESWLE